MLYLAAAGAAPRRVVARDVVTVKVVAILPGARTEHGATLQAYGRRRPALRSHRATRGSHALDLVRPRARQRLATARRCTAAPRADSLGVTRIASNQQRRAG